MENTAIEIKGLNYSIDRMDILKDINLTVKKGEFVGIIGPNGSGKTTLLKCINGILKSKEDIIINSLNKKDLSTKKIAREIALMHQNTNVSFPFPTIDVVVMGRYPHIGKFGNEGKKDYEIAKKNMEFTDTLKLRDIPITKVSGGEKQKVLFAKVLTQETDIILLDEPTSNLDIKHQEQIFEYSKKICHKGKTVIAAVHDLKIATRYCSKLVLLKDGKIISKGEPKKVLTSENLSFAYGVNAIVYKNRITGMLDIYLHGKKKDNEKHVHVIGGGGSSSGVMRELFENGFDVSTGVIAEGDSDLELAKMLGLKYIVCDPFSDIDEEAMNKNIEMIKDSYMTILCNMPFGNYNIKNLEAAKFADKLVIIESDNRENRDFTGGRATEIFNELKKKAITVNTATLHEVLEYEFSQYFPDEEDSEYIHSKTW